MNTAARLSFLSGLMWVGVCLPVMAGVAEAPNAIGASQCTAGVVGQSIPTTQIGEPVAGVTLLAPAWHAASSTLPAYCEVTGSMAPVDRSATAQPIRFAVALPASWQHRAMQLGGGGLNGSIPGLTGGADGPGGGTSALAQGFATYGSDSGHAEDPSWELNDEAIRNLGYMQMKKTHDAAMVIIQRVYGAKPAYNYYIGTSQGGREALTVAERYPNDYDGIAANVPVVQLSGLMIAPALIRIEEKRLARWVPASKQQAIEAEFMRQCDGLDGLQDGVISNYLGCRAIFDVHEGAPGRHPWAAKRCAGNVDPNPADASPAACLIDGQIQTLEFMFSSYAYPTAYANGVTRFGMWLPSTELVAGAMPPGGPPGGGPGPGAPGAVGPPGAAPGGAGPPGGMPAGMRPPGGIGGLLADQRYQGQEGAEAGAPVYSAIGSAAISGFIRKDLKSNPLDYVEGVQSDRRRLIAQWLDSTNADLSAFYKHGGKMILAVGTNDTTASSGAQLDFYQALLDRMGRSTLDQFARLYVVPQAGHSLVTQSYRMDSTGRSIESRVLPSRFDRVTLLRNWVEQGKAPAMSEVLTGDQGTRPLCSYPAYPRYVKGDVTQASSYQCESAR